MPLSFQEDLWMRVKAFSNVIYIYIYLLGRDANFRSSGLGAPARGATGRVFPRPNCMILLHFQLAWGIFLETASLLVALWTLHLPNPVNCLVRCSSFAAWYLTLVRHHVGPTVGLQEGRKVSRYVSEHKRMQSYREATK